MKTIIFIGTNKSGSSYEAIKYAESLNYYTVLLTNNKKFIEKRIEFPNVHLMKLCNISNINQIRDAINQLIDNNLDICAIVSFIDPYCYTASLLAEEYGLKHFSSDAILTMQDKIKSREVLAGSPYAPFFYEINDDEIPNEEAVSEKLPLVLKIPSSAGSKDVYKVETYQQYEEAINKIRTKRPNEAILAEEYLEGPQYLIETVTVDNRINIIAIVEQEITFTGRFIVTGYKMILEHKNRFYKSLKKAVKSIICAHGMENGPCHLEIRYVHNKWKLIEANPRISGGAMNSFIETAYGINLVGETLKLALGIKPNFNCRYKKETFLQYVIATQKGKLERVVGRDKALHCEGVQAVYIKPKKDSIIMPPISMAYRYAYVIATGQTADEARENAKHGAAQIEFHLYEYFGNFDS